MATTSLRLLYQGASPAPVYFRSAAVPANGFYPPHSHQWGEFVYSFSGVLDVQVGTRHYLAPPQYGIWLPNDLEHRCQNTYQSCHCVLYVGPELCEQFPKTTQALTISPLVRAMLEHLHRHPPSEPPSASDERLLRALVDQLAQAPCSGSYLPNSHDPLLNQILDALEANPGDSRSLTEWAYQLQTSERTLMRHCLRDLGMSFADWRQRRRVLAAMQALERGETVEKIARELNYRSPSAFIAMFKRLMGTTPHEYRHSFNPAETTTPPEP